MKKCSKCKKELDEINFSKDCSRHDGLSNKCKDCQRKMTRKHYLKNKNVYKNRQRIRKLEHLEILNKIKEDSGCVICGESRVICLDFHHKNKNDKNFTISSNLGKSIDELLNEVEKCIVVCANCHRIIHSEDYIEKFLK